MKPKSLTKATRVSLEERRISTLTIPHTQLFKIILSHQIDKKYGFDSHRHGHGYKGRKLLKAQASMFVSLTEFIEKTTRLSITEVEKNYKRNTDKKDGTFDPETGTKVQIEHFGLYKKDAPAKPYTDCIRIHGYFRPSGGYFVVTRMDWYHNEHKV